MKYKKILITGGVGFIGSSLAINFKKQFKGLNVFCFDNLKRKGSHLNINRLEKYGIDFIHGDIRNKEDLLNVPKFDLMIEASAEPSVSAGYSESPDYVINTNLMGTVNCLEAVKKFKADMVFLSTSRVYPIKPLRQLKYQFEKTRIKMLGNQKVSGFSQNGISEDFSLLGVRSLYGTTKLASELIIQEYAEMYGFKAIINRASIISGPWQMGRVDQGVIALWVASHFFKKPLKYIGFGGEGKQVRDVLHIDDFSDLLKIQLDNIDKYNGTIFNVGGGIKNSISLMELTEKCVEITGNKTNFSKVTKTHPSDIPYFIMDSRKIKKQSKWNVKKSVGSIINDVFEWIKNNEGVLKTIFT